MMEYSIDIQSVDDDRLYEANVKVFQGEEILLEGKTTVSAETVEQVEEYVEKTFLPDLRLNFSREIGDLVLSWEHASEAIEEPEPEPEENLGGEPEEDLEEEFEEENEEEPEEGLEGSEEESEGDPEEEPEDPESPPEEDPEEEE